MTTSGEGRITTFYSYKGGTGRTMALANVAWILADHGERVLVLDWDLEAPGLHRFFLPFMSDPDLRESDGLVDMVSEYIVALGNQSEGAQVASNLLRLADPRRHAIALQFDFEKEGCLHLLAAGRQDERYAERVRGLDWQQFYTSFGGKAYIERFAAMMRQEYDHVLIDSRTGVADSAGICTMQMPDQVVLCFTYNRQSVEGVAAVAKSIGDYSGRNNRKIKLLPLPTRVVPDIEGLEDARKFAHERLDPHLPDLGDPEERLAFWASAEVPHHPAYGFEETLATFRELPGGRNNMLADMEWLTSEICGGTGPQRLAKMPSSVRDRYLHRFRLRDPRRAALDEALGSDPKTACERVLAMLSKAEDEERQDIDWMATLASTLQKVADRLDESGSSEEAVRANHHAVITFRQLGSEQPNHYRAAHAAALHDFASRLGTVGRRDSALAPAYDAANLYGELAVKDPSEYRPAHAEALTSLAIRLSDVGRRQEALVTAQDAANIYRVLAEESPDAYRPNLASALNNLAVFLSELGQGWEALAPAREAADLYRELASKLPDAYGPDLAMALNTLANCLSEVGRQHDALAAAQEAVEIRRALAQLAPDAYRPNLAGSLTNLANRLGEVGQGQEALAPAHEAADIYRELASKLPDAYQPNFAKSLTNLAIRLNVIGQHKEALAPALEAVAIRRALAEKAPDAFRPDLSASLAALANGLELNGDLAGAVERNQEAIGVLRSYFLAQPQAFIKWMRPMCQLYQERCERLGRKPDQELLGPILEKLEEVPEGSGGKKEPDRDVDA